MTSKTKFLLASLYEREVIPLFGKKAACSWGGDSSFKIANAQSAYAPSHTLKRLFMMLLFSFLRFGLGLVHRAFRVVWR